MKVTIVIPKSKLKEIISIGDKDGRLSSDQIEEICNTHEVDITGIASKKLTYIIGGAAIIVVGNQKFPNP